MTDETTSTQQDKLFSYCFWAKLLVGIPALATLGFLASLLFTGEVAKFVAAIVTVWVAVYIAMKIDRSPQLQGKIVKR